MKHPITFAKISDLPDVLEIEKLSFQYPWTQEDFQLPQYVKTHLVYRLNRRVVGYVIYNDRELVRIAVHPAARRTGVGSNLINHHTMKQHTFVPEENLKAQLFLKSLDFKAVKVMYETYFMKRG